MLSRCSPDSAYCHFTSTLMTKVNDLTAFSCLRSRLLHTIAVIQKDFNQKVSNVQIIYKDHHDCSASIENRFRAEAWDTADRLLVAVTAVEKLETKSYLNLPLWKCRHTTSSQPQPKLGLSTRKKSLYILVWLHIPYNVIRDRRLYLEIKHCAQLWKNSRDAYKQSFTDLCITLVTLSEGPLWYLSRNRQGWARCNMQEGGTRLKEHKVSPWIQDWANCGPRMVGHRLAICGKMV